MKINIKKDNDSLLSLKELKDGLYEEIENGINTGCFVLRLYEKHTGKCVNLYIDHETLEPLSSDKHWETARFKKSLASIQLTINND